METVVEARRIKQECKNSTEQERCKKPRGILEVFAIPESKRALVDALCNTMGKVAFDDDYVQIMQKEGRM